jgi:putative flippase GtrA
VLEPDTLKPEFETSLSIAAAGSEGLHEFIRYTLASGLALSLDTGFLWLGTSSIGLPYLLSGAISFLAGLSLVYYLSIHWVFAKRALRDSRLEFLIFGSVGTGGLILTEIILYVFTDLLGVFYILSKFASIIIVFIWNFTMRKLILFRSSAYEN